jgi:hypothetical protein
MKNFKFGLMLAGWLCLSLAASANQNYPRAGSQVNAKAGGLLRAKEVKAPQKPIAMFNPRTEKEIKRSVVLECSQRSKAPLLAKTNPTRAEISNRVAHGSKSMSGVR